MLNVLRDLGLWFYRLGPANPILVRVVYAGGRRVRHLGIRVGYLGLIAAIVVGGVVWTQTHLSTSSLAELAKGATVVFKYVAYAQLAMVCIIAPVFAAAAITQERDAQTYNILLATPLTNAQIVFGSLLSRMYFIFVLLLAGLPLFCVMMVYGGVTFAEIATAIALAAASALVAGSIAIFLSVIRAGTRRTIFSFYLVIAFYLLAVYYASSAAPLIVAEAEPAPGRSERMSWLAALHPFLALQAALNETPAPPVGAVAHYEFPWSYLAARPAASYCTLMTALSLLLCLASVAFVRASVKEGEPTLYNRLFGRLLQPADAIDGGRSRRPRSVWHNAVAWREAMTAASGRARVLQRVAVITVGVGAAAVLLVFYAQGLPQATTRAWLEAMIAVEIGLALLVATNTAAVCLTREKEGGTLDLLLVTPLVSRDILAGKVRGLVTFSLPMIAVPWLSVMVFVGYDVITGRIWSPAGAIVNPEVLISLPIMLVGFATAACMLGMYYSVEARKTVQAIVLSIAILMLVCVVTGGCAYMMGQAEPTLGALFMPFTPFSASTIVIHPQRVIAMAGAPGASGDVLTNCRYIALVSSVVAAAAWFGVGYAMYRHMIRSFDMTIRRQMA